MRRPNPKQWAAKIQSALWTQEQDIYLIEHNELPMSQLLQHLPFSEEEIMARRKTLGLTTRQRQLRRINRSSGL